MTAEAVERRLTAILAADVVGYSRLMGRDEAGTLARLRALRRELIDPKVAGHKGRIVKTTGDGILAEFPSVVEAVACAVAVQRGTSQRHTGTPDDRIEYRMGIHVGDVIVEDGDIFGDGVNVAARLEALADPGAIFVSARVQEDAVGRLDLMFEDLGEQNLKNIDRPVRVYRVNAGAGPAAAAEPFVSLPAEKLALPDRPSIAVLAFANMSRDPDQEFFADGVSEDIITDLSRNRLLFVIARNSSFTYKGQAVDMRRIAEELGVRYVVEGSVRRDANRIRITAQLIDAETGRHVWAERYDRDLADIFEVQDEITRAIVQAVIPAISQAEQQRAMARPPESLSAWEMYQRALSHWSIPGDLSSADFLQQSVAQDVRFSAAHAMLALSYIREVSLIGRPMLEGIRLAETEARAALRFDGDSSVAHAALAWVLTYQDQPAAALEEADVAIDLNPNDPQGHMIKGRILALSGRPAQARHSLATALRLDPRGPTALAVMAHLIVASYLERDYAAAEATGRRATRAYPQSARLRLWFAATLGQLGQVDEAHITLDAIIRTSATYFKFTTATRPPFFHRAEDHQHLLDGLRKAGWQG